MSEVTEAPVAEAPVAEAPVAEAPAENGKEKKEKKAKGPPRARRPRLAEDQKITLFRENPKRNVNAVGCRDRYDQYRTGMTIKEYIEALTKPPFSRTVGQTWSDLRWDLERNFIGVGADILPIPPQPEAPPVKEKVAKPKKKKAKLEVVGEQPSAEQPAPTQTGL